MGDALTHTAPIPENPCGPHMWVLLRLSREALQEASWFLGVMPYCCSSPWQPGRFGSRPQLGQGLRAAPHPLTPEVSVRAVTRPGRPESSSPARRRWG